MKRQGRLGLCRNIFRKGEVTLKTSSNLKIPEFCKTASFLLFDVGTEKPKVASPCITRIRGSSPKKIKMSG